jgi:hypothetical protein
MDFENGGNIVCNRFEFRLGNPAKSCENQAAALEKA